MMSMEEDDELLQDFLIDAGEILEQLTQQVVDLEKAPDDKEIINAVFRGFHTIKGGASFLALDPMVALCHRTEDVFNLLRNGERSVDEDVMDVVLPVLDALKDQFNALSSGKPPRDAEEWILGKLDELADPTGNKKSRSNQSASKKRNTQISNRKKVRSERSAVKAQPNKSTDPVISDNNENPLSSDINEISEDEFDALLDQFHNERHGAVQSQNQSPNQPSNQGDHDESGGSDNPVPQIQDSVSDEESITEQEFDAILDAIQKSNHQGTATVVINSDQSGTQPKSNNEVAGSVNSSLVSASTVNKSNAKQTINNKSSSESSAAFSLPIIRANT